MTHEGVEKDDLTDMCMWYIDSYIQTFPGAFNYTDPDTGETYPLSVEFDKHNITYLEHVYPFAPNKGPYSRAENPDFWPDPPKPAIEEFGVLPNQLEFMDQDEDYKDLDEDPEYAPLRRKEGDPAPIYRPWPDGIETLPQTIVVDVPYTSRKGNPEYVDQWEDWDDYDEQVFGDLPPLPYHDHNSKVDFNNID
uniref:Uncharacterized protein n=1 Tax=Lotharella oceanica TaxID=641309 RepID=A0A7S2TLA9_9EUKA